MSRSSCASSAEDVGVDDCRTTTSGGEGLFRIFHFLTRYPTSGVLMMTTFWLPLSLRGTMVRSFRGEPHGRRWGRSGSNYESQSPAARRLSPLTVTRKVVLLLLWVALSMPCFALDGSGLLLPIDAPAATATGTNERPVADVPPYNRPYLVICTVDGNILVLDAQEGGVVCGFNSGIPLVGPSEPLAGQDRRIVPGLDGRLYVSSGGEDGLLEPLEITVMDVLANPVKTCKSSPPSSSSSSSSSEHGGGAAARETECGIVTATKSTSLFALDPVTGNLVWQQHPNGTTKTAPPSPGGPVSHTVLLQREDVIVQQISTETGRSVWNVTLGALQALEFGSDPGGGGPTAAGPASSAAADLPPPAQGLLPGGAGRRRTGRAEDLLLEVYLPELPHVVFSEDGTSIAAVDPSPPFTGVRRRRLWSRAFPTVVASVFGLNGRSWEPLTVLEEGSTDDDGGSGDVSGVGGQRRVLPEPVPSGLTIYRAPHNPHGRAPFSVERLYRGVSWLLRSTGWENHHGLYQRPTLPVLSHQETTYRHRREQVDLRDTELYHLGMHPPRLELPSPEYANQSHGRSGGLFLTWQFLVTIVGCFTLGAVLGFRYLYMKKKRQWLGLLRVAVTSGGRSVSFQNDDIVVPHDDGLHRGRSGSDGSNGDYLDRQNPKRLLRSQSMPGNLNHPHVRRRKMSTPENIYYDVAKTTNPPLGTGAHNDGSAQNAPPPALLEKPPSLASRTTTTSSTEIPASSRGVGLIDGSIPLIQYSRYASEFEELGALGKGGFGSVFQCRNALDGREYAIKKVHIRSDSKLPQEEFSRRLQRTLREVKSLALLDHPNIVRYYTAWLEQEQKEDADESNSVAPDSDYDLLSATASHFDPGGGWARKSKDDETSRRQRPGQGRSLSPPRTGRRRPNLDQTWRGILANPIGYGHSSSGVEESQSSSGCYKHGIPGVPDALDDYGFVFDRGDDDGEAAEADDDGKDDSSTLQEVTKSESERHCHAKAGRSSSHGCHRGISFQTSESAVDESSTGWSRESRNQSDGTRDDTRDGAGKKKSGKHDSSTTTKYILYIQMQFCSQKTLANFLSNEEARKGPSGSITGVDIPYALNLFLQVGQGVKHVHNQGLIHRDLKPTNCFVDDAGVVKVGDFGLSRESSDSGRSEGDPGAASATVFGNGEITAGVGTRAYASPEQMKGGSEYDSSTDIYSLGIILFELCYPMYTVRIPRPPTWLWPFWLWSVSTAISYHQFVRVCFCMCVCTGFCYCPPREWNGTSY
jgi:serine/threonine protein kinase